MPDNKVRDTQLENVSGGVVVDRHNYVKINLDNIEGYEYRCKTCGYVGYESKSAYPGFCPRCKAENKYEKTGRFYMDYETCRKATEGAFYGTDY